MSKSKNLTFNNYGLQSRGLPILMVDSISWEKISLTSAKVFNRSSDIDSWLHDISISERLKMIRFPLSFLNGLNLVLLICENIFYIGFGDISLLLYLHSFDRRYRCFKLFYFWGNRFVFFINYGFNSDDYFRHSQLSQFVSQATLSRRNLLLIFLEMAGEDVAE